MMRASRAHSDHNCDVLSDQRRSHVDDCYDDREDLDEGDLVLPGDPGSDEVVGDFDREGPRGFEPPRKGDAADDRLRLFWLEGAVGEDDHVARPGRPL